MDCGGLEIRRIAGDQVSAAGKFGSGEKLAGAAVAGVALGAAAAVAGRRRQAKYTKEG